MNEIWIGLVHVIPFEGSKVLDNALGAYVNAIALAENKEEYKKISVCGIE